MTADSSTFEISLEYLAAANGDTRIVPSIRAGDQAIHQDKYSRHTVMMHNVRGHDFDLDHLGFKPLRPDEILADQPERESIESRCFVFF